MGNRRDKFNKMAEATQTLYTGGSGKYFNLDYDKTYVLRILPPPKDSGMNDIPYVPIGKHVINGAGGNFMTVICPNISMNLQNPCPLCEAANEAFRNRDKEMSKKLRVSPKYLFNIVVRQAAQTKNGLEISPDIEGPFIWDAPKAVFDAIREIINSMTMDEPDIDDIHSGVDLFVRRYKEGNFTKYSVTAARENSPLVWSISNESGRPVKVIDKERTKDVLEKRIDLSQHYNIPTYEEIQKFAVDNNLFSTGFDDFEDAVTKHTNRMTDVTNTTVSYTSGVADDDDDDLLSMI